MKQLCSYGCGKEAKFQQKNGRFCCSKNQNSCESVKNRIRLSNKTSVYAKRIDNANKIIMCSFGCGKPANFYFNNGSYCCERLSCMCLEIRKKNSLTLKNRITWNKNLKNCFSEQTRIKISIGNKGKVRSEENRKQMSKRFKGSIGQYVRSFPRDPEKMKEMSKKTRDRLINGQSKKMLSCRKPETFERYRKEMLDGKASNMNKFITKETRERKKQWMLNGGSSYILSFVQNPSKPQVELYNRIKIIYPSAVLNYPLYELNYSLDIAIPELKIWFESDGSYWH